MRNVFFILISVLLIFAIWFVYSVGFFKPVEIREETVGPLTLIYKEHVGPYHEIIDAISAVETWAKEKKISCRRTFGEYLDNPEVIEHDRLRSLGGCVTETAVEELPAEFKSKTVPEKKYVVGSFHGAPMIGPFKVYPKLNQYFASHNLKQASSSIEVYEMVTEKELLTKYFIEVLP